MIETTTHPGRRVRTKSAPRESLLTIEQVAYLALLGLALGVRLYGLSARPLNPDEAQRAWTVWSFAQGLIAEPTRYTPPLFYSSLLTQLIAGANDLTARIPSLLFGTALVGLPYFLRPWLGRLGALCAAALLAISPVMIFFSRLNDEAVVTATLTLALLAAGLRYLERPERRRLMWLAAAAGAALVAGPGIVTFLLAVLLYAGVRALLARAGRDTQETETSEDDPAAVPAFRPAWQAARSDPAGVGQAVVLFCGVFLVMATGLLVNFGGLQAALMGVAQWFGQFAGPSSGYGPATISQVLLFYEPLVLVAGLVGAGLGMLRRNRLDLFLAVWFAVAWLIATIASQKLPGTVLPVVLPLTLLAGSALGWFVDQVTHHASLNLEGLLAGLVILLAAYALLQFVTYAADPGASFLRLGLVLVVAVGALVVLFAFGWGAQVALRGLGIAAVVVLAVLAVHSATWLNFRGEDAPQEWLLPNSSSRDIRRLVELMHARSYQRERDPNTTPVTVEAGLMPVLGWYLRDFQAVTVAQSVAPDVQTPLLLVAARPEQAAQPGYVGQQFRLGTAWAPSGLQGPALWRWYFFRDVTQPPQSEDVILYEKR